MAEISIHCIDVTRAVPAAGMRVIVRRLGEAAEVVADAPLGDSGTFPTALAELPCELYEVTFHIGDYYRGQGVALPAPAFLEEAPFRFGIADQDAHYHLPLKFTPWGFSLFRGG